MKKENLSAIVREESFSPSEKLLRRKKGPYWEELDLRKISSEDRVLKDIATRYLADVISHGNQALAHLCLPNFEYNFLRNSGLNNISKLETAINEDDVQGLTNENKIVILERLTNFNESLEKQKKDYLKKRNVA